MDHLPIFLNMKGQKTLVVGGGAIASRKIRLILKTQSNVCVIAPSICPEIASFVAEGRIQHLARKFEPALLSGANLVFAATDIDKVDREVSRTARAEGILVNVADRPQFSDFIMPSIVDRAPIVIAISSSGTAPVLARHIRAQIEALIPKNLGALANFANRFRNAAKAVVDGFDNRRKFWESFFDGPIARLVLSGDEKSANDAMLGFVNGNHANLISAGAVHYLDAPIDQPDLMTFKAMNALQSADLIIFDERIPADFMDYARRDAEQLFVGVKNGKNPTHPTIINRLLSDAVKRGRKVVRLTVNAGAADLAEQNYLANQGIYFDHLPVASISSQQPISGAVNLARYAQA